MLKILLRAGRSGRFMVGMAAACAFAVPASAAPAQSDAPILGLPVNCIPGETCWIAKFVDLDSGPGVRDYACQGRANNKHSGTDFALRDLKAMADGVAVVAAAGGTVLRARDGSPDISARDVGPEMLKGGECGNGVIIDHGGKWRTQYCHMRQGSIAVKLKQKVEAGQKLGLVGMSGSSEYPHLHLTVLHGRDVIDPFVGVKDRPAGECGPGPSALWHPATLEALAYTPAPIYNAGFAEVPPSEDDIRSGRLRRTEIDPTAPAFILWTELYGVEAGDKLHMRLTAPAGGVLVESTIPLEARKARWFQYIGKRRRASEWPAGDYTGEITLTRETSGTTQSETRTVTATVPGAAAVPAAGPGAMAPGARAGDELAPPEMPAPQAGPSARPAWIPSDELFIPAFVGTIVGFLLLIFGAIGVRMWRRR